MYKYYRVYTNVYSKTFEIISEKNICDFAPEEHPVYSKINFKSFRLQRSPLNKRKGSTYGA